MSNSQKVKSARKALSALQVAANLDVARRSKKGSASSLQNALGIKNVDIRNTKSAHTITTVNLFFVTINSNIAEHRHREVELA